jgi:HEAT repeat protein
MAARALGMIRDDRAVMPLVEALEGEWPALWTVAEALGQQMDSRAVGSLASALHNREGDTYVQDAAAEALGWIGESIQEELISVLREGDEKARRRAITALGQMRDAENLGPLIDALRYGQPWYVHEGALEALVRLGEPAVGPLVRVLQETQEYDAFARQRAARALGIIGDPRALEPLSAALRNEPIVRRAASEALAGIQEAETEQYGA